MGIPGTHDQPYMRLLLVIHTVEVWDRGRAWVRDSVGSARTRVEARAQARVEVRVGVRARAWAGERVRVWVMVQARCRHRQEHGQERG